MDTTSLIYLDRLRAIEAHLVDLKDGQVQRRMAQIEDRADMATLTELTLAISKDASATRLLVADTNKQVTEAMKWARRAALAAGLIALTFQHLTVEQMARLIRTVLGI